MRNAQKSLMDSRAFPRASSFSAKFSNFFFTRLTYLGHFFLAPVYFAQFAAALDMPCDSNNGNRVNAANDGQEIP
jgi:hypothetical protein